MKKNTNFARPELRGVTMNDYFKQHKKLASNDDIDVEQQQEIL